MQGFWPKITIFNILFEFWEYVKVVHQWKDDFIKKTFTLQQIWILFFCHSLLAVERTVLLSVLVTGSQLSQFFAARNWVLKNKSLTLSFGEGKFKFDVSWGLFIEPFFHWDTFTRNQKMSKSDFQSKCLFSKIISRFFQTFMSSSKDLSAAKSISFWWRYASCKLQSHMQFYPFSGITFFSRCF